MDKIPGTEERVAKAMAATSESAWQLDSIDPCALNYNGVFAVRAADDKIARVNLLALRYYMMMVPGGPRAQVLEFKR